MDENVLAVADRIKAFVREYRSGGCRILSERENCQCQLCNVDRLLTAIVDRDAEIERLKSRILGQVLEKAEEEMYG